MNFYDKIYLGIYKLFFSKVDIGEYSSAILLSVLIASNVISICGFLATNEIFVFHYSRGHAMALGAFLIFGNLTYFIFTKRHKVLLKKMAKDEDAFQVFVYAIAYLVISVVLFLYTSSLNRESLEI